MRLTKEIFIERSRKIHGDKYDYSKVEYVNMKSKVKIICVKHGEFDINPHKHILGSGCRKCFTDGRRSSKEYFINKSIKIHGDKYDYSKVEYINDRTNVVIICPEHGEFNQPPNSHFRSGCSKCGLIKRANSRKNDIDDLINKFKKKHGDKYDYSKVEYIKMRSKILIMCKLHNCEFYQAVDKHLESKTGGCPKCNTLGKGRLTNESFIEKANQVHNNLYDYNLVEYVKSNVKVKIKCNKHGEFEMTPNAHLDGRGCRICNRNGGIVENIWLNQFNILKDFRQYKIDDFYVDGFDPINGIIYEFYGDFWHGNPKVYNSDGINRVNGLKYGDLYRKTIEREEYLKLKGYKVVSIWESDFKKINNKLCQ